MSGLGDCYLELLKRWRVAGVLALAVWAVIIATARLLLG
jgi:hypothetical protein